LVPIEVHYIEKNPGIFSSKTLISFRLKKEIHGHLGWHGFNWCSYDMNYSFTRLKAWTDKKSSVAK